MDMLGCIVSFGLTCSTPPPDVAAGSGDAPETIAAPAPKKGEASKLLVKVQAFYDGTRDFEARFTQTYVQAVYGTKTTSDGVLRVKKPGAMVWDYAQADSPDFWLDGTTARVVDRDAKQVLELNVEDSDFAGATKFLFGGRQILDDFLVRMSSKQLAARYGMPGHSVVDMQPRIANPHYQQLLIVIDDATGRVDAFVVFNSDGSTNHFALDGFKRDPGLPDEQFELVVPKGFKVVAG